MSLGGSERKHAPQKFRKAFAIAREGGLGSAPHAGELAGGKAGAASIRGALDVLHADRIRHGIRAVDDPALLAELAERGIVCDVTPVSNLRTGAVASLDEHPLPAMLAAGVRCSISSDDPVLMDTDLAENCAVAEQLGHTRAGHVLRRPARRPLRRDDQGEAAPHRRGVRLGGRRRAEWTGSLFGLPSEKGTCYCPNRNQWSRFSPGRDAAVDLPEADPQDPVRHRAAF